MLFAAARLRLDDGHRRSSTFLAVQSGTRRLDYRRYVGDPARFFADGFVAGAGCDGVDATIAVQADQSEAETEFLLGLAEGNRRIAGVVGWVDLRAADVERRLEHFSHFKKLRGVRHIAQGEADDRFLARPEFVRGVGRLKSFGLTYDILIFPRQLPAAIELVGKAAPGRNLLSIIWRSRRSQRRKSSLGQS